MENKYIGSGQAAVMLTMFAVFCYSCMNIYGAADDMLINSVVTAVSLAVLAVPVVILGSLYSKSVPELMFENNRFSAFILSFVYIIYFVSVSAHFLKCYAYFVTDRYFEETDEITAAILLGLVCIYISHTGAETVCRMSTVLLFLLTITSVIFIVNGWNDIIAYNINDLIPKKLSLNELSADGIFPAAASGTVCLCILCKNTGKRTRKSTYLGIFGIFAASTAIIYGISAVIGDYLPATEYPWLDAVIYSSRETTFRPDGIFFLLWTVTAASVISLLCSCGGHCISCILPKLRCSGTVSGILAISAAVISIITESDICSMIYASPLAVIILLSVIPLILLLLPKTRKNNLRRHDK